MKPALPACTACEFHTLLEGVIHLCTLPPECAPPPATQHERDEFVEDIRAMEERGGNYIGTDCDRMRRMGATCGPRGRMWSPMKGAV